MSIRNEIKKVSLNGIKLEVTYKEHDVEENYINEITKKCAPIVHNDLRTAFLALRPFLITISEQTEAGLFNVSNIDEKPTDDMEKHVTKYVITGYSLGGSEESAGVTLIGQKILKSGQVLNLIAPFTKYEQNDSAEAYPYAAQLCEAVERCNEEVKLYLFEGKYRIIQKQLDFEEHPDVTDVTETSELEKVLIESIPKKKRGRKRQEIAIEVAYA
ncbi:hypothetical protein EZS27_016951 [termite gut metagenome]|uniref:Uncharacterized protein n=1 Tax=termite gut metagenome TaxID=433724 RepID=A0A5J4RMZ4_9ZZZZ